MIHATPEKFPCFRCGACCQDITEMPDISSWATASGICRYYSANGCTCQIYDKRPAVCNVWRTYRNQYEKQDVSWDDFVYTNMLNCCLLRYLQGIEEPEESPFYGEQEEIATVLIQDLQNPRLEANDEIKKIGKAKKSKSSTTSSDKTKKNSPKTKETEKTENKELEKMPETKDVSVEDVPAPAYDFDAPLELDVPDIGGISNAKKAKIPKRKPNKHRGELL